MSQYKKGQRLKVELEVTVNREGTFQTSGSYECLRDSGRLCYFDLDDPEYKVTPVDPKGWPPQVGDIWLAAGEEYFARKSTISDGIIMMSEYGHECTLKILQERDPNPLLVRRK